MALVIVRLKLALLRGSLRKAKVQGLIGVVFALLLAIGVGATGGLLFATVRFASAPAATDLTIAAFAVVFFVWLLGPVVTAASDGTLPPERLAPFPLSARQLMPGLVLASGAGFGGLCTALVLAGAFVGLAPPTGLALVTALALVAQFVACVVFSRLLSTAISSAARRRRGRDLALVIGPLLALGLNLGLQVILRSTFDPANPRSADLTLWRSIRPFLAALPSGPPALAAGLAREGNSLGALVALVASVVVSTAGVVVWHRVLVRTLTSAGGSASDRSRPARPLFPWFASWLPRNRVGAVAARELRLTWRDPRQRAALFGSIFAPVLLLFSLRTLSSVESGIVLLGIAPALFIAIGSANLWGYDGRAAWTDAIATGDRRDDVIGKVIARALVGGVLSVIAIAALALRVRSGARVGEALALGVGAFGLACGVAVVLAVRNPYPMPESTSNVFSSGSSGQGFGQASVALGLLFGSALVVIPVGALLSDLQSSTLRAAVAVLFMVFGVAVLGAGIESAGNHLRHRAPEVLEKLIPERA